MPLLDQFGGEIQGGHRPGLTLPRYDQFALPHVLTHASIIRGASNTYLHEKWDEAMRDSRQNALAMRRDCWLRSLMDERINGTVSLKWELAVEEPKDPYQKGVADLLTRAVQRIPRFRQLLRHLLDALWYGRHGVQVLWDWQEVQGQRVFTVKKYLPVNGDKIGYNFNHIPYVLLHGGEDLKRHLEGPAEVITTTIHRAMLLKGSWRSRFIIHKHAPEDSDFFEGDLADAIHGVGIRSVIYWLWFLLTELSSWQTDHLERIGLGLVIITYEEGNAEAEAAAEQVAKQYSRRTIIKLPVPSATLNQRVQGGANGVQVIETPTQGLEVLEKLKLALKKDIERYIVGQHMSAGDDNEDGLGGTGRANFAADTKRAKLQEDAEELGETLTGSDEEPGLVSVMHRWTSPQTYGRFPVRFRFILDEEDPAKKLEAVNKAVTIGVTFKADEVRELTGMSKPGPDDEVVGGQQQGMGGMPGMPGAGPDGMPGQPGPDGPGADPESGQPEPGQEPEESEQPAGQPGQSPESQAFLEHLAQFSREQTAFLAYLDLPDEDDLLAYALDDPELLLYGSEDWSGPHQGKRGGQFWINVNPPHRKVYGAENPGKKGDAHRKKLEEARGQKTAAKEEKGKQRQVAEQEREATYEAADAQIKDLLANPDPAKAKALAETLGKLPVKDLQALKQWYGLRASGTKPELARKIAEKALSKGQKETGAALPKAAPDLDALSARIDTLTAQVEGMDNADIQRGLQSVAEELKQLRGGQGEPERSEFEKAFGVKPGEKPKPEQAEPTASPEPQSEPGPKEAWQTTLVDWRKMGEATTKVGEKDRSWVDKAHRGEVKRALAAGKPVPPEVLADYPDLAGQAPATEAGKPEKQAGQTLDDVLAISGQGKPGQPADPDRVEAHQKQLLAVKTPDEKKVQQSVQQALAAAPDPVYQPPTIKDLYDRAKQVSPSLTPEQFNATLLRMQSSGQIELQPHTRALGALEAEAAHLIPGHGETLRHVRQPQSTGRAPATEAGEPEKQAGQAAPASAAAGQQGATRELAQDLLATHEQLSDPFRGVQPLIPDLYDALKEKHPGLTEQDFHKVLTELQQRDLLTMQTWDGGDLADLEQATGHAVERFPEHSRLGARRVAWIQFGPNAASKLESLPASRAAPPPAQPPPPAPAGKQEKPKRQRTVKPKASASGYGQAGSTHPLAGKSREEQARELGQRALAGDSSDPLGLIEAGWPAGLDRQSFEEDVTGVLARHAQEFMVGPPLDELYEAVAAKHGLSKHDFLRAVTALHVDDRKLRLSGWSKSPEELPDPELAAMIGSKVMAWAHPPADNLNELARLAARGDTSLSTRGLQKRQAPATPAPPAQPSQPGPAGKQTRKKGPQK